MADAFSAKTKEEIQALIAQTPELAERIPAGAFKGGDASLSAANEMMWGSAERLGITREEFEARNPEIVRAEHDLAAKKVKSVGWSMLTMGLSGLAGLIVPLALHKKISGNISSKWGGRAVVALTTIATTAAALYASSAASVYAFIKPVMKKEKQYKIEETEALSKMIDERIHAPSVLPEGLIPQDKPFADASLKRDAQFTVQTAKEAEQPTATTVVR